MYQRSPRIFYGDDSSTSTWYCVLLRRTEIRVQTVSAYHSTIVPVAQMKALKKWWQYTVQEYVLRLEDTESTGNTWQINHRYVTIV